MSLSMRPIREEWGEPTSLFLDTNAVVDLLANVCDSLDVPYGLNDCDEGTEVIIHEGEKFLDYIASSKFTAQSAHRLLQKTAKKGDLNCLVDNLRTLVDNWRGFLDGDELRILVD